MQQNRVLDGGTQRGLHNVAKLFCQQVGEVIVDEGQSFGVDSVSCMTQEVIPSPTPSLSRDQAYCQWYAV